MQEEKKGLSSQQVGKTGITFLELIQFTTLIVMIITLVLKLKEE